MEMEQEGILNYLDVAIHNFNGKISTNWYRKPSNTLTFTDWNLMAPKIYKTNLIKNMIKRLYIICSGDKYLQNDLHELKLSFLLIEAIIRFALLNKLFSNHKNIVKRDPISVASQKVFYLGIKYYNNHSVHFSKSLLVNLLVNILVL